MEKPAGCIIISEAADVKMLEELYKGYRIIAEPVKMDNGRWAVNTIVEKSINDKNEKRSFYADDGISYILEIEAAKESINFGKHLIDLFQIPY